MNKYFSSYAHQLLFLVAVMYSSITSGIFTAYILWVVFGQ